MEPHKRRSLFDLSTYLGSVSVTSVSDGAISLPVASRLQSSADSLSLPHTRTEPAQLTCATCGITFESSVDQRAHFQSEWHRFNLKLRLVDVPTLSLSSFESLGEVDEEEDGASSSSSSDEDKAKHATSTSTSTQQLPDKSSIRSRHKADRYLKNALREKEMKEDDEAVAPTHIRSPKISFITPDGAPFSIWRVIINDKLMLPTDSFASYCQQSLRRLSSPKQSQWTILVCSGGRFAGAVFQGPLCVAHKTFHRYTTRRKQGGSQSAADNKSGTSAPQSAGASLRRYNEARLREDIQEVLREWTPLIQGSSLIFLAAPRGNTRSIFYYDGSPVDPQSPRLHSVPFPVDRPTFSETMRIHSILSTVEFGAAPSSTSSSSSSYPSPSPSSSSIPQSSLSSHTPLSTLPQDTPTPSSLTSSSSSISTVSSDADSTQGGRSLDVDPLYLAIRASNLPEIRRLLEEDIDYELMVPESDANVPTPIFEACQYGDLDVIAYLAGQIPDEINIGIPAMAMQTPLHFVSARGDVNAVVCLLEHGADPTTTMTGAVRSTPYDLAKMSDMKEAFLAYAEEHPDAWDWSAAHVPLLTQEQKEEREKQRMEKAEKRKQHSQAKKDKRKEAKQVGKTKKTEEAERKAAEDEARLIDLVNAAKLVKEKSLTDRERRALAAEARFKPVVCAGCTGPVVGVPFERLEFKYCSTNCLANNMKVITR
eukprot:TRINITY_DN16919_c0_g1_i1.p1 TRINITY_DN16919_c0_g1~~TRINITY_DN16919_c0_g1_i1.p1  ORF type:complete len:715 (-),score=163.90 TRINITY_DN16919_c0_g1_i1:11-2134(-)